MWMKAVLFCTLLFSIIIPHKILALGLRILCKFCKHFHYHSYLLYVFSAKLLCLNSLINSRKQGKSMKSSPCFWFPSNLVFMLLGLFHIKSILLGFMWWSVSQRKITGANPLSESLLCKSTFHYNYSCKLFLFSQLCSSREKYFQVLHCKESQVLSDRI